MNDDNLTYAQGSHRYKFLKAVFELVPESLAELRALLPACREMFVKQGWLEEIEVGKRAYYVDADTILTIRWVGDCSYIPGMRNLDLATLAGKRLDREIRSWAVKYNVQSVWVLDGAVSTLCEWTLNSKDSDAGRIVLDGWFLPAEGVHKIRLSRLLIDELWDLDQPWAEFEHRVLQRLRGYKANMALLRTQVGFDPECKENGDRFSWLALFQAGKKSPDDIRLWESRNGRTLTASRISQGIKEAAELCGIQRRAGARGPSRS